MVERVAEQHVRELAQRFGWMAAHVPAPMRWDTKRKRWVPAKDAAGLPDWLLVRGPRLVVIETKSFKGKLTTAQEGWLDAFREFADWVSAVAGTSERFEEERPRVDVLVIRPGDFDELVGVLR